MNRFVFFIVSLLSGFLLIQQTVNSQPKQPNILFIIIDDMNDWVGYLDGYGGEVQTPNIDRLASQGMAFSNAHTSAPVCNPSRNALMLGKLPSTTGLYNNGQWWKAVYPEEVSLPQYFKEHGYRTAGAGKIFHHTPGNNPPVSWNDFQEQVFDDPWNFAEWSPEQYFLTYGYRGPILQEPDWKPLNDIYPRLHEFDWGPIPGKDELDYGDIQAVKYGQNYLQQDHSNPFFLSIGIYRPHLPWHVPQKYFDMYPLEEIVLPEVNENDLNDIPEIGREFAESRRYKLLQETNKQKEAIQAYLASITFADARVGEILNALKESQYTDNTIIVLVSDHGWHLGEKEHFMKQTLWEEATRIPFIVKVPDVTEPGSISDKPVDMLSLYPTLISLAGLPEKTDLEGHGITPLLKNPEIAWEYPAVTIHGKGNVAIRSQNWRYIRYHDGGEELYNHREDPNEWTNLADDEDYNEVIEEHQQWIPSSFADPVAEKEAWFFDPYEYTWLHRETADYVDGKK